MTHRRRTIVIVMVGLWALTTPASAEPPLRSDPTLTPGDVLTTDAAKVCQPGYSTRVRHVPQSVKNLVYKEYGITSRHAGEYEIDHNISIELGGSNSMRNLWPQSYETTPLNAHVKDTLENTLHRLVCTHQVVLAQAQQEIATDWMQAYVKYVGPLPGGGSPQTPVPRGESPLRAEAPRAANPDGSCPASAPIKVTKSGLYHLPGDAYYARSKAQRCVTTEAAAVAAGYQASQH